MMIVDEVCQIFSVGIAFLWFQYGFLWNTAIDCVRARMLIFNLKRGLRSLFGHRDMARTIISGLCIQHKTNSQRLYHDRVVHSLKSGTEIELH